jgi:hypothetical protein
MGVKNKENFRYHYELETSNNRCACGPGSEGAKVKQAGTIDFINDIIKKYNIKSISDCPCGLFENWMYMVDLSNVRYIGHDINDLAISRNKKVWADKSFIELDLVNEILPMTDLIICRDCLFHLPNDFVVSAIKNFKESGSTYLLATEHRWIKNNIELTPEELSREAGFRQINIEIEPFNLGEPIEIHNEEVWKYYEQGNNRQLSLWKLN